MGISRRDPAKVEEGTELLLATLAILTVVGKMGGVISLEHPTQREPPPPSIWATEEVKSCLKETGGGVQHLSGPVHVRFGVQEADFHRDELTRWLKKKCVHGKRAHDTLQGRDPAAGK